MRTEATARNIRVQDRYDKLMTIGRHGHYETMFQIVREETEQLCQQLAKSDAEVAAWRSQAHRSQSDADRLEAERDQLRQQLAAKQAELDNWKNSWAVAMEVVDNYAGDPPQAAFEKLRRIRETMDEALAVTKEPKP